MEKIKRKPYTAKTITGAEQRVRQLQRQLRDMDRYLGIHMKSTNKLQEKSLRPMVERLVEELYATGTAYEASRLVLWDDQRGCSYGGYCKSAMVDRILYGILRYAADTTPTAP
jgi:valyl-tRNA synthetase